MKKLLRSTSLLLTAMLLLLVVGCTKEEKPVSVNLNISAAASLKDAMNEIKQLYETERKGSTLTINFGSSGTLQQQIEQGAEVDLFISAAAKQMNTLETKDLIIKDTRKNLLENAVVLVVPKNESNIASFEDLTTDKISKLALGEPKAVPAGQYAEEVFTKLGILDKVKGKAVYAKDVKEVLTWVETENADAGIVYATDAKVSDKVKIAATAPADSHSPVVYPAAVIKASKQLEAAKDFMKFLSESKVKAVFEKYGFKMN